jgi:hypothetical protein
LVMLGVVGCFCLCYLPFWFGLGQFEFSGFVAVCERLNCPFRGRKMTNAVCSRLFRYIFFKHQLYTLLPCTSASQFASIHR